MSITGIPGTGASTLQSILSLQNQLADLQRQLGTGQKSDTYAGLGLNRGLSVALRAQAAAVASYQQTSTIVGTRLSVAQTSLTAIDSAARQVLSGTSHTTFSFDNNGKTTDQVTALGLLDQIIGALNVRVGDQYIFSGKSANTLPVVPMEQILNGNGGQAGLTQLIAQRKQADLGSDGLGRLTLPPAATAPASLAGAGASIAADVTAAMTGTNIGGAFTSAGGTLVINSTTVNIPAGADATAVLAAINAPGVVAATGVVASQDVGGNLVLTANTPTGSVSVDAGSTLLGEMGLSSTPVDPVNLLTQGVVQPGQTMTITIGANPPVTITFCSNAAAVPPEVATLAGLNAQLASLVGAGAATAAVDAQGNLTLTAANTSDTISITGSADPSAFGLTSTVSAPNTVSIGEDVAGSPFGFKLAGYTSTLRGATVATSGPPAAYTVNFASNPVAGDALTFNFDLPDGTTSSVTLTATMADPPGEGQFTIGASPADTAASFQAALKTQVGNLASTTLVAASAMAASNDFFNIDGTHPPQRVNGPPYDTATSLVNGTTANTVFWYQGDGDSTPARATAGARVDASISVSYGMRANEDALRNAVRNIAVFAATSFSATDPNSNAAYLQLEQRVGTNLSYPPGTQKVTDIEAEIANAQTIMKGATDRQTQTQSVLSAMLDTIAGVSPEEVGTQILALQTRLQASLQTTALLARTSLVNYLSP